LDNPDLLEHRDHLAFSAQLERLEVLGHLVQMEDKGLQELLGHLAALETVDPLDRLVLRDPLVQLELPVSWEV